jgi:hypothetical protein
MPHAMPARLPYRDAIDRPALGALRLRSTEQVSCATSGNGIAGGGGLRRCLHCLVSGSVWTSGATLLLFLLARFPGHFSLLSRLVVVLFGHGLSGGETMEGRPQGRHQGHAQPQTCACVGRGRVALTSYYSGATSGVVFASVALVGRAVCQVSGSGGLAAYGVSARLSCLRQ